MSYSSLSNNSDHPSPSRLSSAAATYGSRHIDVNSNAAFRSLSPTLPLSGGDAEEQDHFNPHRRRMEVMDDTVRNKSVKRNRNRGELLKSAYDFVDIPVTREQMNHYRIIAENSQSELAALHVKYETAQSELLDLRSKISSKEVSLQELKAELENCKESNARQASMITSLRARVQETEEESGIFASSKTRAELAMQAVLQENQDLKDRVHEMESRLRTYVGQLEDTKSQASRYNRGHGHFVTELSACLGIDILGKDDPEELLISKAGELYKGNTGLRGRVATLEHTINVHETESKASRETILKLVSELNREKKKSSSFIQQIDSLHKMVIQLEGRVCKLNEQLQNQADLHQEAMLRAKRAEQQLEELRARFKMAEGELVSGDVLRDNLSYEKQKYMKFLEQLSDKMKLERITADVGFDMRLDVILARADQLVKLESNAVIENKTLAHGLQRKLKAQKEKYDSKELHMDLLRKKIAQLEEEKQVRTALAVERDEANLTVRSLQKKVERLQKELNAALESITELKSRLSDTNELKIKTMEQHKTIEHLNKNLDQLQKVKGKTQKKLLCVKSELDFTEKEAKEDKEKADNFIDVITSELKTLKKTLEEVSKREKQLVDFREVVSRMLGLNVNALALPDYEIIKRLEGLLHSHHHHTLSCA
ncbi:coiled-coil domain-containing protein 170 isoform X2 [Pseudophryne corroboree]|uniref:coiled-coil domain-containing protein 170 isoform X2 n=1 Tax=Pseudophryne corroboree TaxID=495146 RepID=UPI003081D32B